MSIEKLTENVEIIQTLGTFPNQDDGLTPEELKIKFDEGAKVIKDYLNDVVVPAVNDALNKPGTPGPAGPQGERGLQGEDGYSPQVRIVPLDVGHRVEIDYKDTTGAEKTVQFDVFDGEDGKDAPQEAILFTPQPELTESQKDQARENIGAIGGYYSTEREVVEGSYVGIDTAYVRGLYDALMENNPVTKNEIVVEYSVEKEDGTTETCTFTNYEYVISTGDHNEEGKGKYPERDLDIKKPKYLIMSGIHGTERQAVISTYRFVKDLLAGKSALASLLEGAVLHVLPVGTPDAFDAFTYENANGKNINRNFTATKFEKETQAIANWINANSDADLFIDHHNGGTTHEVAMLIGTPDNQAVDTAKKIALRGLDRIIPYWRDVIGYSKTLLDHNNKPQDVVFSYSVSRDVPSSAAQYAVEKYGVTSFGLETSAYQNGNYSDYNTDGKVGTPEEKVCTPETVAAGAEALGNILIEFYKQALFGEVSNDMKTIDDKLDQLLVASSFIVKRGTKKLDADEASGDHKIDCPNGAKAIEFHADTPTLAEIKATTGTTYITSVAGNCFAPNATNATGKVRSYMAIYTMGSNGSWYITDSAATCTNTDGVQFSGPALKAGTYNWTAYYWND